MSLESEVSPDELKQTFGEGEQRFRDMIDVLPAAIYTTDAKGRLTHFNSACVEFSGRVPEIGSDHWCVTWKLFYPDGRSMPHDECPMAIALKEGRIIRGAEAIAERPDGTRIWFVPYPTPLYDNAGNITGGINMLVDITERKQAEVARASLAAIVETSDDAIITKSLDGVIRTWNTSAERLFGYSAQEAIGQPVTMLIPTDRHDEESSIIARLRRGERVDHFETQRRRKDGSLLDISLTISPVKDADGRIVGASKVARDITERKAADARLEADLADSKLLQSISAAMIQQENVEALYDKIMDAASKIMRSDYASMQMLYRERGSGGELRLLAYRGFSPETAKFWEWVRTDSNCTCGEALRTCRRALVTDVSACDFMAGSGDQANYLKDGILAAQSTPLISRSGELIGMISTHWKQPHEPPERDLRLLDILARQAADLIERRKAEEALREADRRKNEFLAMLAHELRNPLAPIRNAVQVLRLKGGDETVQAVAETMERQVGQLVRMVDDLLDVNRIGLGKIELRRGRVELASIVHHAVEAARPICENLGHELSVTLPEHPVYLDADPARLAQVLSNLLTNACKFTNDGGRITLTAERQADDVVIRVRDNGIGIAADQLPHIFSMFIQADTSLERSVSGLGIGLTLVKNLVQLHGGTVEAHSDGIGQGSEFVVRLPISVATAEPRKPVPTTGKPAIPRRILVVDDNRDSAKTLAMLLNVTGHQTRTAFDGLEAVSAAETFRPEVVLLDIGLPKLNGYDTAITIRQQPWGKNILLVALTGWGQDDDRQKSKDAGFDVHMVKPLDHAVLKKLLAQPLPQPV